jgi:uncharacterized repeat protein (TIGR03803 family)
MEAAMKASILVLVVIGSLVLLSSGSTSETTYTIGGKVSGLSGTGLVLQDNGGNNLPVGANGSFKFTTPIADGDAYKVTVLTQPSDPAQTCTVKNGDGTATAKVTDVEVACEDLTGAFEMLYSFDNADGRNPYAGLVRAKNGDLYGTTWAGNHDGNDYSGAVFQITSSGTPTTLYYFCSETNCADGELPYAGLVQGSDGKFYGTMQAGGTDFGCDGYDGCGTIFKITSSGKLTTLYTFCKTTPCVDGTDPYAALVQGSDGDFYGTTEAGGLGLGNGTVFKITSSGKLTTLYKFCQESNCTDGGNPYAALVQGANGNFYGTTNAGGAQQGGCAAEVRCGTVFKITPNGKFTTLYSFCSRSGCPDGQVPNAALVQGSDGSFYGTTEQGGHNGACPKVEACGTIFRITPSGTLTTLYSFCSQGGASCTDGSNPYGALIQDPTDGDFFGTTWAGGAGSSGTVFRLSIGLEPY